MVASCVSFTLSSTAVYSEKLRWLLSFVDVVILVNFLRIEVILRHSGCSIFVTTALGIIQ